MRLLIDNALSPTLAVLLREAGHTALHVREVGLQHAARSTGKPSVILFRGEGSRAPSHIFALIQANAAQLSEPLRAGVIAIFEPLRLRVRPLPIGTRQPSES